MTSICSAIVHLNYDGFSRTKRVGEKNLRTIKLHEKAYLNLIHYLETEEGDIASEMENKGDLKEAFKELFNRDPKP